MRPDEQAVSPVIGVVLMVVLVVGVGAVVSLLVQDYGGRQDPGTALPFKINKDDGTMRLIGSTERLDDWFEVGAVLRSDQTTNTCSMTLNGASITFTEDRAEPIVASSQPMQGGDVLQLASGASGSQTCTLTLVDLPAGKSIGQWVFRF